MMFNFGSALGAVMQYRAAKRLAEDNQRKAEAEEEFYRIQALAYDAERWPHCIDVDRYAQI